MSYGKFCNCLPTESMFTAQVVRISLESVKNFKGIQKTLPFILKPVFI